MHSPAGWRGAGKEDMACGAGTPFSSLLVSLAGVCRTCSLSGIPGGGLRHPLRRCWSSLSPRLLSVVQLGRPCSCAVPMCKQVHPGWLAGLLLGGQCPCPCSSPWTPHAGQWTAAQALCLPTYQAFGPHASRSGPGGHAGQHRQSPPEQTDTLPPERGSPPAPCVLYSCQGPPWGVTCNPQGHLSPSDPPGSQRLGFASRRSPRLCRVSMCRACPWAPAPLTLLSASSLLPGQSPSKWYWKLVPVSDPEPPAAICRAIRLPSFASIQIARTRDCGYCCTRPSA